MLQKVNIEDLTIVWQIFEKNLSSFVALLMKEKISHWFKTGQSLAVTIITSSHSAS